MSQSGGVPPAASTHRAGQEAGGEVSLVWFFDTLLRQRRTILLFAGVGLLAGVALALIRGRTYTTVFSFLPQTSQGARGGLAGLAGQFGIPLSMLGGGDEHPPQLYADLLMTREVLAPIALDSVPAPGERSDRIPVAEFLKVKGDDSALVVENTMRSLRRDVISTTVAARSTGMVTVRVRTRSADASLEIAERLLEGLNHFNLITRQSTAREERRFTEERLAQANVELRTAEDALQAFSVRNRQPEGSPVLMVERDRLQRAVQFHQQVVSTLAQQYEENRIREVRDTPVITVFERPVRAARADPGLRALISLLGAGIGLLLGIVWVVGGNAWRDEWRRTH
jgi:uncharacterized protein involved in exopolysaccharide biosynthesis